MESENWQERIIRVRVCEWPNLPGCMNVQTPGCGWSMAKDELNAATVEPDHCPVCEARAKDALDGGGRHLALVAITREELAGMLAAFKVFVEHSAVARHHAIGFHTSPAEAEIHGRVKQCHNAILDRVCGK